jgi:hypothetical protein
MTPYRALRAIALSSTRDRFWMPTGGLRNFLDESISEEVAKVIRSPYRGGEVAKVLIDGWQLKNAALQYSTKEIETCGTT